MRIEIEQVDNAHYSDIIISPEELKRLKAGEILEGGAIYKRRKVYVGLRLQGVWDFETEDEV